MVKIDGKEIERINLDDSKEFIKTYYPSKGQYNTIEVKMGTFVKDNSPDQIAVKTGWISEPGQTSICIPHRFILEIVQQYSMIIIFTKIIFGIHAKNDFCKYFIALISI